MSKYALLSVSDKTGLADFAQELIGLGFTLLSTGGTEKTLKEAGIEVTPVEDLTKFPECFSGRVKTMHPVITGGILFRRGDSEHEQQASEHSIPHIDVVVVNLYPFEETTKKEGVTRAELIEQIDIGGPTLLRSAAKNAKDVTVICDIADYDRVIAEMKEHNGNTTEEIREELALKVFVRTSQYDAFIAGALSEGKNGGLILKNGLQLRYGENPHQWGMYYDVNNVPRAWSILQEEKKMSYLNVLDADGAWNLVNEFSDPTVTFIKHANPCGVASNHEITEAFQRGYDADRLSAFGVIIALNRPCTKEIIQMIIDQKIFTEVIIAPGFEPDAVELLKSKPRIRAIECEKTTSDQPMVRSMMGGILMQNFDDKVVTENDLKCVTEVQPTAEQIADLLFAWKVVKHAKSNAIVFAKDGVTTGIGCGQTSRVDSTVIAARRAGEKANGSVMASDAFFPFPDSVEEAAKNGIAAIIQPGGSIKDEEVIAKANELQIPMVFTGIRGFKH